MNGDGGQIRVGALKFARNRGFKEQNMLSEAAKQAWLKWKAEQPKPDQKHDSANQHDTVGMVGVDLETKKMVACCSTSGSETNLGGYLATGMLKIGVVRIGLQIARSSG